MNVTRLCIVALLLVAVSAHVVTRREVKAGMIAQMSARGEQGSGASCFVYSCVADGASCFETATSVPACSLSSYCNGGVCSPSVATGAACKKSGDCVFGDVCPVVNGSSTVCTTVTFNGAVGTNCTEVAECTSANYCSNDGVCVAYPTLGQACVPNIGCGGALDCSPSTFLCINWFSVAAGGVCAETADCDVGLYCTETGVCATQAAASKTGCSGSCSASDEVCSCDISTVATTAYCAAHYTYTTQSSTDLITYANCIQTANCAELICSACTTDACTYFHSNEAQFPPLLACYSDPAYYGLCGSTNNGTNPSPVSTGTSLVAPVGLLLAVSAAAAFL